MAMATNLGFPRMGAKREVKKLVEGYWAGNVSEAALLQGCKDIRRKHWELQRRAGIAPGHVPSNDFSLFDHVLDHVALLGAVPERYQGLGAGLETYFAMARGLQRPASPSARAVDVAAMEMKKWLDTNYHFFVPELGPDTEFKLSGSKPVDEFLEARAAGIPTRPVLLGPVSFLLLSKPTRPAGPAFRVLELLPGLLGVYQELLGRLEEAGAEWVQLDEPLLCLDHAPELGVAQSLEAAYGALTKSKLKLLVATYFERADENLGPIFKLPVAGIHVDLVRAPGQLPAILSGLGAQQSLSLGLVDGRNIWRADLDRCISIGQEAVKSLGPARVLIAPSCSLLHCPHSLEAETAMDPEVKSWMAFALEKLKEVQVITTAINEGLRSVQDDVDASREALASRRDSPKTKNLAVREAIEAVGSAMLQRRSPFPQRQAMQRCTLSLPLFPTTTIGSFPQTREVRAWRARMRRGELTGEAYDALIAAEVEKCVRMQEALGLDVLVHGEFERTDMVEFFGEQLQGCLITQSGWVQSYGSRCVKPPVIFGDVARTGSMTVGWAKFAQGLTRKPVKGMLTGPITCLQWSFVRNDQPKEETARQLALVIREEVGDLERAGIRCIQIDEAAIREGLPLRKVDWEGYLEWAVDAFLLASTGVEDRTQIHTHMCYSDFNDIFPAIQRMDADVLTVESSKSDLKLLQAFQEHGYCNEIGPGVYDIHSPRVPSKQEMGQRLQAMLAYLSAELLWVNPDCGLKTRGWPESEAALYSMVQVAMQFRNKYKKEGNS